MFTLNKKEAGAATLIGDEDRFGQYIQSTIIEATINKDILMDTPISKPALLRQTFELGAAYSGELLSLNKMLGSLQDAGNTVTLAGYINLLDESGLLRGLQKFSTDVVAIEVKSNGEKRTEGLDKFRKLFNPQAAFIVGDGGISAEDFLSMDLRKLF